MSKKLIPAHIASYLQKRGVNALWQLHGPPQRTFSAAVVIPSLAEAATLPLTLESLSHNPDELLDRVLILVVVNQRADATAAESADNLMTLESLPQWKRQYRLDTLYWIDAASSGSELPAGQGVGLARKIGMDLALPQLEYSAAEPFLICLDADTVVQPDYLPALFHHFSSSTAGGASISYRHRPAADEAGQSAIDRYELFLRSYVLGLEQANSPYAFHTIGSAMACRATAYVISGGMNRRLAGEDFYFLQQVHKTSGVATVTGTTVHPSPRSSHRVPFGTGRAVGDMLHEGEQRILFYDPIVFSIIGKWLACVVANSGDDAARLLQNAATISPVLHDVLTEAGFAATWENLKRNSRETARLLTAFHGWFDAFRTMRCIHELSDRAYPRIPPPEAVAPLLKQAGEIPPDSVAGQLELLRRLQI